MRIKQGHLFRTQVGLELAMQLRVPLNSNSKLPRVVLQAYTQLGEF